MSAIKEILFKCFQELDENFFEDFIPNINKRIVFQKYGLFFATIFDLKFGSFSLYIHGPYNSSLADIGYEFAKNIEKMKMDLINFPKITVDIINFLKNTLSLSDISFLEVFSTYFYLKNYSNYGSDEILEKVNLIKKDIIEKNNIDLNIVEEKYKQICQFLLKTTEQKILI